MHRLLVSLSSATEELRPMLTGLVNLLQEPSFRSDASFRAKVGQLGAAVVSQACCLWQPLPLVPLLAVEADSDGAPSAALPQRAAMGSVAVATDVTSTLLARAAREEVAVGSVPIPAPAIVAGAVDRPACRTTLFRRCSE